MSEQERFDIYLKTSAEIICSNCGIANGFHSAENGACPIDDNYWTDQFFAVKEIINLDEITHIEKPVDTSSLDELNAIIGMLEPKRRNLDQLLCHRLLEIEIDYERKIITSFEKDREDAHAVKMYIDMCIFLAGASK